MRLLWLFMLSDKANRPDSALFTQGLPPLGSWTGWSDLLMGPWGTPALFAVSVTSQNGNMEPAGRIWCRIFDPQEGVLEACACCAQLSGSALNCLKRDIQVVGKTLGFKENFTSVKSTFSNETECAYLACLEITNKQKTPGTPWSVYCNNNYSFFSLAQIIWISIASGMQFSVEDQL